MRQAWQRHITTNEPFNLEYRLIASDGHLVWVHGEATIVKDDK
ncbi:MAG: PAS domain-containing protein, partial [Chloroflexales bacterium]|nr:PAS domain-containing protein [Chloroflexales bacterium]